MIVSDAWLAGLLEGEGCFTLQRAGSSLSLRVTLSMTDEDVVRRAASWGGRDTPVQSSQSDLPNRKKVWHVTWYSSAASELMWAILPYMGGRRTDKILTAMSDWYEWRMRVCVSCGSEFSLVPAVGGQRRRCYEC